MPIYEGYITTIDGEHQYTSKLYVIAEKESDAQRYFVNQIKENHNLENYEERGKMRGWWNEDHTTYTYLEWTCEVKGIVIPIISGGATHIKLVLPVNEGNKEARAWANEHVKADDL